MVLWWNISTLSTCGRFGDFMSGLYLMDIGLGKSTTHGRTNLIRMIRTYSIYLSIDLSIFLSIYIRTSCPRRMVCVSFMGLLEKTCSQTLAALVACFRRYQFLNVGLTPSMMRCTALPFAGFVFCVSVRLSSDLLWLGRGMNLISFHWQLATAVCVLIPYLKSGWTHSRSGVYRVTMFFLIESCRILMDTQHPGCCDWQQEKDM